MTSAISHRGPDGQFSWQNEESTVLLGHQRLSIIDLSPSAAQPMHYLGRYIIVHNGEIYNYIELRKELEQKGYHFTTQSDTEVILAAFDHWDYECVDHFDGMFAFAIWDKEEKELFAARDRFGEKPFFYHVSNEQFFFASEMKALWAAGIPRVPNLKMLFNYITIGYVDNPARPEETFYETVFKLPPASRLYYSQVNKELVIEKYWDIDPGIIDDKISVADATEKFLELLTLSVKRRLRSDVSIGTSLSGGLDSSTIATLVASLKGTGSSFSCFTAGFPGFDKDEVKYAASVAAQHCLHHHIINVAATDMAAGWETFIHHQEEPVGSSGVFAQFKVFELARQHDVTVLLDGQGADETMAGYPKYYKWYWQELFQKRKLTNSGELAAASKADIKEKFGVKNIMAALFPDLASNILERRYLVNALRQEELDKNFVKFQSREAYYSMPAYSTLNERLHFNTCVHGLQELLRYADRNSMAHGREVRLPFLNHELVEFIFRLPAHFKIKDAWTKWILRQAMNKKLPDTITWRRDKTGFEAPQQAWMQHQQIQEMVMEARKKLIAEKILSPGVIEKPVRPTSAYDAEPHDWRYLSATALWKL